MNKLHLEIMEQAILEQGEDPAAIYPVIESLCPGLTEKFARLLVNECANTSAMFSIENKRIHPAIDPKNMPMANQTVYHSTCQSVAWEIRDRFGLH